MSGELISREALERIIQRAAELQTGERDIGEGLTKEEVLALGQEVGIPARYLQQAVLEEQTRTVVEARRGPWAWLAGPRLLSADRVVPGEKAAVERPLSAWMQEEELLQVKRRFPDRTTWEPKAGAFASIQRALGAGGKTYALARAAEVAGEVTPLESGFCHVRLLADVRTLRQTRVGGATGALGFAGVMTAVLAATGVLALFALLPLPVGAVTALAIIRSHRAQNEKIQVALEQVLDRLERGEIKPEHLLAGPRASAFSRIADEIRRTFQV